MLDCYNTCCILTAIVLDVVFLFSLWSEINMGMRVSCLQENLARGLNIVSRAVGTRTTLPVLSNVLLATDNGRLRLAATNLDMAITAWIGASVEEDGRSRCPPHPQ